TETGRGVLIRSARYSRIASRLKKKAAAMGGTDDRSLTDPLEKHVRDFLLDRGELTRSGHWLLSSGNGEEGLSPMAKGQLTLLKEGKGYANPAESKARGARENWEAMGRMGLVRYEEGLVMTEERYREEADRIVRALVEKGPAELSEIRPFSELSRREVLILLAWMEGDGLILNKGDLREAVR
ncbi:MAG: hypothetical protein PQJ60_07720, partial [Spirochaetales bacterium]|nr:hypothetical protein [Spirochaetales bacterium]